MNFKNINWNKLKPKSGLGWVAFGIAGVFVAYALLILLKFILILAVVAGIGAGAYGLVRYKRERKEAKQV